MKVEFPARKMPANRRSRSLAPSPTIHYPWTDPSEPARLPPRLPLRWGSALALGLGTTFCHPAARVTLPTPAPALDACAPSGADSARVPDTLVIGVSGAVDPVHAPIPYSDAERIVFRQLYETLIRIDCAGLARPGLADSWSASESGRRWTFTLRDDAAFSDGSTVTAADVIASWQARARAGPPAFEVAAEGARVLGVRLREPASTVPLVFADPGLAVTRLVPDRDWPAGTGTYTADTSAGRVIVTPNRGGGLPVLVLRSSGAGDARDLLDAGVDLLVTDDPAVLSYAAGRPGTTTTPLPWDRTYVLLGVAGVPGVSDNQRAGLARDAVRVAARPATAASQFWWFAFEACRDTPPPFAGSPPPRSSRGSLAYADDDRTARDLAERLVALGTVGLVSARALGVPGAEFAAALAAGGLSHYVVSLPRAALDPCAEVRRLLGWAPWLAVAGAGLEPLVDTRRHVIVRRGAGAFTVDWDGILRVR